MKNIHVLPTENESRIRYNSFNKVYELCEFPKYHTDIKSAHNIYITSDEEIEDGDWVYFISTNEVIKVPLGGFKGKVCKKIILTTDQYLIKDGVQAIDDEFLEWLIKNPSCEEVETDKYPRFDLGKGEYKIIIPKEEPKQFKGRGMLHYSGKIIGGEPKQETLEKAAKECFKKQSSNIRFFDAVYFGAKWQQEQDKNRYSEEEVLEILNEFSVACYSPIEKFEIPEWFKKYKKK